MSKIIDTSKGFITLWGEFHESASGHHETDIGADLYAVDKEVIMLETYNDERGFYKGMRNNTNHNYYQISVGKLIDLIKQNGEKTDKKEPIR